MARKRSSATGEVPNCPYCGRPGRYDPRKSPFWWCDHCKEPEIGLFDGRPFFAPGFLKPGNFQVDLETMLGVQREAVAREDYVVDYIEPPCDAPGANWRAGRVWPIYRRWLLIIKGDRPSVCPGAVPRIHEAYLPLIAEGMRSREMLPAGHTLHFVGEPTRNLCACYLPQPRLAEVAPVAPGVDRTIQSLPRTHIDLLFDLADAHPDRMSIEALANDSRSERSVGTWLRELTDSGHVIRPQRGKGACLTDRGWEVVRAAGWAD